MAFYEQTLDISVIKGTGSYQHIKYSNDGLTFTANDGEVIGTWIGMYTDSEITDSTNFNDYRWKKYVGEDAYTVVFTNEHIGIAVDVDGKATSSQTQTSHIVVYKGTAVFEDYTIGSITSPSYIQTTVRNNIVTMTVNQNVQITDINGVIIIPIIIGGLTFSKEISYTVSRQGQRGYEGYSYSVLLTNESTTFPATGNHAYATTDSTGVVCYMNSTQVKAKVTKIANTTITGTSIVPTGIVGLTARVYDNDTNNTRIQFIVATTLTQTTGSVEVEVESDGHTFTKHFTYSLVFDGEDGTPARLYRLKASSNVLKRKYGSTNSVTFSSWYRDGNEINEYEYDGYYEVRETFNDLTYNVVYRSESPERHMIYSGSRSIESGNIPIQIGDGTLLASSNSAPSSVKVVLYGDAQFEHVLDEQSVLIIPDVDEELRVLHSMEGETDFKVDEINRKITEKIWQNDIYTFIDKEDKEIRTEIRERINDATDDINGSIRKVTDRVTATENGIVTVDTKVSTAQQTADMIKWVVSQGSSGTWDETTF